VTNTDAKRILILGVTGMLGNYLVKVLPDHFVVLAPKPNTDDVIKKIDKVNWLSSSLNVNCLKSVDSLLVEACPDIIINCAAITPHNKMYGDYISCIRVNGLLPHYLSKTVTQIGCRLIHLSTDGVFSGDRGNYKETDMPCPGDLYTRTKLIGEVTGCRCLTLRTSFFGINHRGTGLVNWLINQVGKSIEGYKDYIFSGLSLASLARSIVHVISSCGFLTGLYHLGGPAVSKYDLLVMISRALELNVDIRPVSGAYKNLSLDSSNFYSKTGLNIPTIDQIVEDVKLDFIQIL